MERTVLFSVKFLFIERFTNFIKIARPYAVKKNVSITSYTHSPCLLFCNLLYKLRRQVGIGGKANTRLHAYAGDEQTNQPPILDATITKERVTSSDTIAILSKHTNCLFPFFLPFFPFFFFFFFIFLSYFFRSALVNLHSRHACKDNILNV